MRHTVEALPDDLAVGVHWVGRVAACDDAQSQKEGTGPGDGPQSRHASWSSVLDPMDAAFWAYIAHRTQITRGSMTTGLSCGPVTD